MISGFSSLEPETQENERRRLQMEARENEGGCLVHWKRSVLQVKNKSGLVPPDHRTTFARLTDRMVSDKTTLDEFTNIESDIRRLFPNVRGWLDWWMRPTTASMIFPARYTGSQTVRSQVPKTSNPVESQHSLLHRSGGVDHDILAGIEGIVQYVDEFEARYNAVLGVSQ